MCPIMTAITENCSVIIMDIKFADCAWKLTRHRTTIITTTTSNKSFLQLSIQAS